MGSVQSETGGRGFGDPWGLEGFGGDTEKISRYAITDQQGVYVPASGKRETCFVSKLRENCGPLIAKAGDSRTVSPYVSFLLPFAKPVVSDSFETDSACRS
jgi:hypothetical protein